MKKFLLLSAVGLLTATAAQAEVLPYSLQMPESTEVWHNTTFFREDVGQIGMGYISLKINAGDVNVNRESTAKVYYYYNGELLNTLDASNDAQINMSGVVGGLDDDDDYVPPTSQEVSFYIAPNPDDNYFRDGEYKLVIEDGVFQHGNEEDGYQPYEGVTIIYNYTNVDKIDMSYVLKPKNTVKTPDLKEITMTFPNAKKVTYDYKVYDTLKFPDGTAVRTSKSYASVDGNSITFYYTDPANGKWSNEWVNGEYTFTIPAYAGEDGGILVDNVAFPGAVIKFQVGIPELKFDISFPAETDVFRNHTKFNEEQGVLGMSFVQWELKGGDITVNRESEGHVTLYYEDEVLSQLDASNDAQINMSGVAGALDNDDEYEAPVSQQVSFYFGTVGEDFLRSGKYTIVVDKGVFHQGNDEDGYVDLDGATVNYEYQNVDKVDWTYTLTPADGAIVENDLKEITIEFPNATKVSWDGMKVYDTLVGPDGVEMRRASSYPKALTANKVGFYYNDPANGKWSNDWKEGLYTFTIPAAGVDAAKDDNVGLTVDGVDFPGVTAFYKIGGNEDDTQTSVEIYGMEPAASYTVVALDGKLIVKNGDASTLLSLTPGIYVINGKKVVVKK